MTTSNSYLDATFFLKKLIQEQAHSLSLSACNARYQCFGDVKGLNRLMKHVGDEEDSESYRAAYGSSDTGTSVF